MISRINKSISKIKFMTKSKEIGRYSKWRILKILMLKCSDIKSTMKKSIISSLIIKYRIIQLSSTLVEHRWLLEGRHLRMSLAQGLQTCLLVMLNSNTKKKTKCSWIETQNLLHIWLISSETKEKSCLETCQMTWNS